MVSYSHGAAELYQYSLICLNIYWMNYNRNVNTQFPQEESWFSVFDDPMKHDVPYRLSYLAAFYLPALHLIFTALCIYFFFPVAIYCINFLRDWMYDAVQPPLLQYTCYSSYHHFCLISHRHHFFKWAFPCLNPTSHHPFIVLCHPSLSLPRLQGAVPFIWPPVHLLYLSWLQSEDQKDNHGSVQVTDSLFSVLFLTLTFPACSSSSQVLVWYLPGAWLSPLPCLVSLPATVSISLH